MTDKPWLPANENMRGAWRGLLTRGNPQHGRICKHEEVQAYQRTIANGTIQVVIACTTCFQCQTVKKVDHPRHLEYPAYPAGARDAFYEEQWQKQAEEWRAEREAKRAEESAAWWAKYSDYLRTPKWRRKRELVLARAKNVCEACLEARATEVHHTTYKHLFNEPLFELRAVCHGCHELITSLDRGEVVG